MSEVKFIITELQMRNCDKNAMIHSMLKKFEKMQKADWTKVAGLNTLRNLTLCLLCGDGFKVF